MNNICTLSDINIGETACVTRLCVHGSIRRRFQDIGLIEGTKVECVLKSPYGDPSAYEIRGAVIAIRCDDSKNIYVDKENKKWV